MKKNDIVLIAVLLVAAVLVAAGMRIWQMNNTKDTEDDRVIPVFRKGNFVF